MAPKKVAAGQPLGNSPLRSAAFVNNLVDATNFFRETQAQGRVLETIGGTTSTDQIRVKNLTGANRDRGDVVQLGNYLLDEIDHRNLWFEGNTVADPADKKWAILGTPCKTDEIRPAFVSGVCVANIDVTDTSHRFAKPAAGQHVLSSTADSGPIEILSPLTTTGTQTLAVRLGGGGGGSNDGCHTVAGFNFGGVPVNIMIAGRDYALFINGDTGCLNMSPTTSDCCGASGTSSGSGG